jgi:hypothetical protein
MALPATEAFTGAVGALAGSWTHQATTSQIGRDGAGLGNTTAADGAMGATAFWSGDTFPANQYAKIVLKSFAALSAYGGVLLRASGTGGAAQGYELIADGASGTPNHTAFIITTAGSAAVLASVSQGWSANDELRAEMSGSLLIGKRNGTTFASVTDSTYTSGSAGIRAVQASRDCADVRRLGGRRSRHAE